MDTPNFPALTSTTALHPKMNQNSLLVQRSNQNRLHKALLQISSPPPKTSPSSSHSMPDHSSFFSPSPQTFYPPSPPKSPLNLSPTFIYPPPSSPSLHVDIRTSKLSLPTASPFLQTPVLPTLSSSPSHSTCSSSNLSQHSTIDHPTVFAAAITAAMIIDPHETVPKRPRSPALQFLDSECELSDCESSRQSVLPHQEHPHHNLTHLHLDQPQLRDVPREKSLVESPTTVTHFSQPMPAVLASFNPVDSLTSPAVAACVPVPEGGARGQCERSTDLSDARNVMPGANGDDLKCLVPVGAAFEGNVEASKKRRAEAMERFRRKKAVRCYGRKVRYQIRKRIATTRPRVNGRFARRVDASVHTVPGGN